MDIEKLIKQANSFKFSPSQQYYDNLAVDAEANASQSSSKEDDRGMYVPVPCKRQGQVRSTAYALLHPLPPNKKVKKSAVKGKYKRHKFRKAKGVKQGFSSKINQEKVTFRVEMMWRDIDTEEETNEQVHWIECKKFTGEQYRFYRKYFDRQKDYWGSGETVESEFVCRYIGSWLILNREQEHLNSAFIFPATNKRDDEIRDLIYEILWTGEFPDYKQDLDLEIVLKANINHLKDNKQ